MVYCADVGSIKKGNFGWARVDEHRQSGGSDIGDLVVSLTEDINRGEKVSLGFECPLYVPISDDPFDLTSQRPIDHGMPWSAAAGTGALAVGLTETVWVLERLRAELHSPPAAFLSWNEFSRAEQGLFLWEAMVTGDAKGKSHEEDALVAIRAFQAWVADGALSVHGPGDVYSLIGAALLRTGWSDDIALLKQPCTVIRA